jgi:hypothetical protein
VPAALLIEGFSKAENISGGPDKGYSIFAGEAEQVCISDTQKILHSLMEAKRREGLFPFLLAITHWKRESFYLIQRTGQ